MNARASLRKWSPIKIFMYLSLAICSLLIFWCRGASAMHLAPFDYKSSSSQSSTSSSSLIDGIKSPPTTSSVTSLNFFPIVNQRRIENENNLKLQKLWQMRMKEKRLRMQAHRREKMLLQSLLNQHPTTSSSSHLENLKHQIIDHNVLLYPHHNHNANDNDKNNFSNSNSNDNVNVNAEHRRENLFEVLNEIRANISVASSRNRRESRLHNYNGQHHNLQQQQHRLPSSSSHSYSNSNYNNNNNNNINHHHPRNSRGGGNGGVRVRGRGRKGRYCSASDPRTLAFEALTVFEGKIKSMTTDRTTDFSATVEIIKVHKQQTNYKLPKQVRLQFAYRNTSECDIYREEFRHRGFVRDELEQGRIYFFFVKQVGLSNFTILGQPIRKISRTAKDVEIGVNAKYGKVASIESLHHNFTNEPAREGKRVRISCKTYGEPAPKVTWFKDGKSINRNKTKFEFVVTRRRSDLIIKSAVASDSGRYECRAKNKLIKKPVSKFITLTVNSLTTDRTNKLMIEGRVNACPTKYDGYCLNNGTCWIVEVLEEVSCDCKEGFTGKRCIDKTTNLTPKIEQPDPFILSHHTISMSSADYDDDDN